MKSVFLKKIVKNKISIMILTAAMMLSGLSSVALVVRADNPIGKLNNTEYTSYSALQSALKNNYRNQTVVITMLRDWTADMGPREAGLIIPENCTATLNMNGFVIARGLDSYVDNGSVIIVNNNASLTVNGSTNGTIGLITGGFSRYDGGGLYVKDNCSVELHSVKIYQCIADDSGGGIYIGGENSVVSLYASSVEDCSAYDHGGGAYVYGVKGKLELRDGSRIKDNHARDNGGGVMLNKGNTSITGKNGAYIQNNQAGSDGSGDGGGVYVNDENITIRGLSFSGNTASNGGGLYLNQENISLSDLTISGNTASVNGGGIYVWDDAATIADCTVTRNTAAYGAGVYVKDYVDVDFHVDGATVIKENTSSGNAVSNNLYISDNAPQDSRVMFDLSKGADVHMGYYNTRDLDSIMVTRGSENDTIKSKDCTRYLTADNPGYYFDFEPAANMRKIVYKKGTKPVQESATSVSAQDANNASAKTSSSIATAGVVGTVGVGGEEGSEFDLIKGFYTHSKTDADLDDNNAVFYYSDGLFYGDPYTYNHHLGTASMNLAFSACYLQTPETADANGNTYYNKHAGVRQFLADIGCPDENIIINDSYVKKPETDSIGVAIASKALKRNGAATGDILLPVVIRGGGYEREWASNLTLGAGNERNGEAQGFSEAADQVITEIDNYIAKYDLTDEYEAGKIKFWINGYSRAGATANITAKRLVERLDSTGNQVFAYCSEAAKGGTDTAETLTDKSKYYCIHNMINMADMVPRVGPQEMGFKRYGVDHYTPGTAVGSVVSSTRTINRGGASCIRSCTTYRDNDPIMTKSDEYINLRDNNNGNSMIRHLKAMDSDIIFDDYFHPMELIFLAVFTDNIVEEGGYDGNCVEDFLDDFVRFLQEGTDPGMVNHWSQAVPSRAAYAEEGTRINGVEYSTIQQSLRDAVSIIYGMSEETAENFLSKATGIIDKLPVISVSGDISLQSIYDDVIGDWHTLTGAQQERYIQYFWELIEDSGALDAFSDSDREKLERDWPTLAYMIFNFVNADYNYHPGASANASVSRWATGADAEMMFLATFITHVSYILSNHYLEINLAWVRQNDSWYATETKEYRITAPASVAVPSATAVLSGTADVVLTAGETPNAISGETKVVLDNTAIVGEAIYYDLKENGVTKAVDQIYRGGIGLILTGENPKDYEITAYDMSYGVKSSEVTYKIRLSPAAEQPETHNLVRVISPSDISGVSSDHNTTEGIRALLPANTKIIIDNGYEIDADITWDDPVMETVEGAVDTTESATWIATGTVALPASITNTGNIDLGISITVDVGTGTVVPPSSYNEENEPEDTSGGGGSQGSGGTTGEGGSQGSGSTTGGGGSSGGGSESSSGGTAPSVEIYQTPTDTEDAPEIATDAVISEGKAIVYEIKIEEKEKENSDTSVILDFSEARSEVTSVELTNEGLSKISEAVIEEDNNINGFEIKMSDTSVAFDEEALDSVISQCDGKSLTVEVSTISADDLSSEQKTAVEKYSDATFYEMSLRSGGNYIHDLGSGKITAKFPATRITGLRRFFSHVIYIAALGITETFETFYVDVDDKFMFTTDHCSTYAVVYDPDLENATRTRLGNLIITVTPKSPVYTGKKAEPGIVLKTDEGVSVDPEEYTISYSKNKNPGKASVFIRAKTDSEKYTGSVRTDFSVKVTSVTEVMLRAKGRNLKVTAKRSSSLGKINGYQIRYRIKGSKKWKTLICRSKGNLSGTITGLRSGKKYEVKVRAFATVSGKKKYGAWSKLKRVVI